jgi:hypothetical protein
MGNPITAYLAQYWGEILAVIIGGAILSVVGWLVKQALKARIVITPTSDKTSDVKDDSLTFGWYVENTGPSKCYELAVGIRIQDAQYEALPIQSAEFAKDNKFLICFECKKRTPAPVFRLQVGKTTFVQVSELDYEPELRLEWEKKYKISLVYNHEDSLNHTQNYILDMGLASKPLLKLTETSTKG